LFGYGSEQNLNKFESEYDQKFSNFLKIKDLIFVKMIFMILKFSFIVILKSIYVYSKTKFKFRA